MLNGNGLAGLCQHQSVEPHLERLAGAITTINTDSNRKICFLAKSECGQTIFLPGDRHHPPVIRTGEIVASPEPCDVIDWGIRIGDWVCAVVEREERHGRIRAQYWCLGSQLELCWDDLKRIKELEVERQRKEAERRQAEIEKQTQRTAEPNDVDEALAHGWKIHQENRKQVILKKKFPGERHPRYITRQQRRGNRRRPQLALAG